MIRSVRGKVRIIKGPEIKTPTWIPEKCEGLVVSVTAVIVSDKVSADGIPQNLEDLQVVAYCVNRDVFLRTLNSQSIVAAEWFWKNWPDGEDFYFDAEAVELVVRLQDDVHLV